MRRLMKKVYFILFFSILSVTMSAEENISLQTKPLLYLAPGMQYNMHGMEKYWEPLVIIDIEFQYSLNKKLALSINPIFAQGFWKYVQSSRPVGGPGMAIPARYWSSHCLDFVTGVLYFPLETGLKGLYLGAYSIIGWGYINHYGYNDYEKKRIANFLNLGFIAEAGYQWIFNKGFTISLGAGLSSLFQIPKQSIITSVNSPLIGDDYYNYGNIHGLHFLNLPIDPRLKVSIGYSF